MRSWIGALACAVRHAATESRLAAIEARVAQLEAARTRTVVHAAEPGLGTGDQDDAFNAAFDGNREPSFADEPPTPEEEEAKLEADQLRRAQAWARVLRTRITPDTAGKYRAEYQATAASGALRRTVDFEVN